jgi:Arc/MetJ-type ribon-helix-helix transcriptional regulator
MDAEVKGRVPQAYAEAVDKDVTRRQRKFPRASRADVLRDALTEYFAKRGIKLNGKEHAHAG